MYMYIVFASMSLFSLQTQTTNNFLGYMQPDRPRVL